MRYQRGRDLESRVDLSSEDTVGAGLPLPNLQSTRTDAYIRAGYGDPDAGRFWAQLVASSLAFQDHSVKVDTASALSQGLPVDSSIPTSPNRNTSPRPEINLLGVHLSATERIRVANNVATSSPSARASIETGLFAISAFAEANAPSAWPTAASPERILSVPVSTVEGAVRFTPLPFISLSATAGRQFSSAAVDAPPTSTSLRGEAAIRLGRLWVGGGVMTRDTALVQGLSVYDTTFLPAAEGRVTGRYATVRGPLWKIFNGDLTATDWGSAGPYRPRYEVHGELSLATEWLKRFPRHTFAIRMWGGWDYRSDTSSRRRSGRRYARRGSFSAGLEIRVLQATIFWEDLNLNGFPYDVVPSFLMPRQINVYGVRWAFWN